MAWLVLVLAASSGADPAAFRLRTAVQDFEELKDERARDVLDALLAGHPPPPTAIAAKAHIYLGLIALNANDPDRVRSEFKAALTLNPAIELPTDVSPKANIAFVQARGEFERDVKKLDRAPKELEATPLAEPPPPALRPAPAPDYHLVSWVLIAVGIAAEVTAIVGGAQVLSYNSETRGAPGSVQMTDLVAAQGRAQVWSQLWLPFAIGGGVAGGAAVLTW